VGRPGFKPGGWRQASPGGFDSRAPPPVSSAPSIYSTRLSGIWSCEYGGSLENPFDRNVLLDRDVGNGHVTAREHLSWKDPRRSR
jgi:hypothetical protein